MSKNYFKLYLIIISAFFVFNSFFLHKIEAGHFCECVPSNDNNICYVERGMDIYGGPDKWSCTIFKTGEDCCDKSNCGGESPCCYGCVQPPSQPGIATGSCSTSKSLCEDYVCPDTTDYNSKPCELIVPCTDGLGGYHCRGMYGKWDASEKQCVACDGTRQSKKIVDTTQKCYTRLGGIFPETSCRDWQEDPCASISTTCEGACGATEICDERESGKSWIENGVRRFCDSDCQFHTTFVGDINLDRKVNIIDITIAAKAFGSHSGSKNWNEAADVANPYGVINIVDIGRVALDWGKDLSTSSPIPTTGRFTLLMS